MINKDRITFFSLFILAVATCGGLLFGYHTAILSGVLSKVKDVFELSILDEGILVSIILLGGLVGALCAGGAADKWGRKKVLLATALIFSVGTLLQATAHSYPLLLAGRFFTGLGVGIASVVSPLYLAEIAPTQHRGSYVCIYQLLVAGGILLAYALNWGLAALDSWRIVFYIGIIPSAAQFMALFFVPETPAWLTDHATIENTVEKPTVKVESHLKKLIIVGVLLSIFQQITGINTIIYYAPKIFAQSGENSPLLITFIIGSVNFLFTILSVLFLDKLGRRLFLLTGISTMIIGQILLTLASWIPFAGVIGALIYVIGFALGLGPITWVFLSEIYPLHIRGKAMGLALFANWLFNYLISLTFLILMSKLGLSPTFMLYGILSLICLIFIYFYIPETKGKSLEEIEFLVKEGKL